LISVFRGALIRALRPGDALTASCENGERRMG